MTKNNCEILENVYTSDFAYLIGSLLGDGCLYIGKNSYQFSITSEDYDFCEKCQNIVKEMFNKKSNIKTVKKGNRVSYYQLVVCSKKIVYFLKKITKDKTVIPDFIYKNDIFKKSFVQGIMDSDGWISKVNASDGYIRYRVGFKNISPWTVEFKNILTSLSVKNGRMKKVSNSRSLKKAFCFTINTFDYCNKIGFRINRKKRISKEYLGERK